jgi:hypothetical protein
MFAFGMTNCRTTRITFLESWNTVLGEMSQTSLRLSIETVRRALCGLNSRLWDLRDEIVRGNFGYLDSAPSHALTTNLRTFLNDRLGASKLAYDVELQRQELFEAVTRESL